MSELTWPQVLNNLVDRRDLDSETAKWAMGQILAGKASVSQIAGFMVALRAKGETANEITGLAEAMLANSVYLDINSEAVDVVGSGGDRANTVNISTMAAIVAAGAGARVVKHGNRAASSKCGTADCLERLGVKIDIPPEKQSEILKKTSIVFLFAPIYHPALRYVGPTRKELGIKTIFNLLGPIANPGRPEAQAIGVYDDHFAPIMAEVLAKRGTRGLVFHGRDGLDELTTTTTSKAWFIDQGRIVVGEVDPAKLSLKPAQPNDLVGGDPEDNANVVLELLAGKPGPVRDIVLLNAAATLLAFHGVDFDIDVNDQLRTYLAEARQAIDSGAAQNTLDEWIKATN